MIDRYGELTERQIGNREVLRQLEAQRPGRRAVGRPVGEVERARIAGRNAPGVAENHLQQRQEIPLRGKGDANLGELGQLRPAEFRHHL